MALMVFILAVYSFKWALHFQYLRVKHRRNLAIGRITTSATTFTRKRTVWRKHHAIPPSLSVELTGNETEDFCL